MGRGEQLGVLILEIPKWGVDPTTHVPKQKWFGAQVPKLTVGYGITQESLFAAHLTPELALDTLN